MIDACSDKDFVGEFFPDEGLPAIAGLKNALPSDGLSVAMMDKILARDDKYLTFWP